MGTKTFIYLVFKITKSVIAVARMTHGRTTQKWIKSKKYIQNSGHFWPTIVLVFIFKLSIRQLCFFAWTSIKP